MKNALMTIPQFCFILLNLKFFGEIITPFYFLCKAVEPIDFIIKILRFTYSFLVGKDDSWVLNTAASGSNHFVVAF